MPLYHTLGQIPRKRHIVFRKPDGGLYSEELMGHEGFVGTSSLLYHTWPPTTVVSARKVKDVKWEKDESTSLRHRHFLTRLAKQGGSPTLDRTPILFNAEIGMLWVAPDKADQHFYRNSQADEVVYVAEGAGTLESVFGARLEHALSESYSRPSPGGTMPCNSHRPAAGTKKIVISA